MSERFGAETMIVRREVYNAMKAKIAEYEDALRWYSQDHVYAVTQANEPRSAVHQDRGKRAIQALAGTNREDFAHEVI